MNIKKQLMVILMGLGVAVSVQASSYEQMLLGKWRCQVDINQDSVSSKSISMLEFFADGTSTTNEITTLSMFGIQGAYRLKTQDKWTIDADRLNVTLQNLQNFHQTGELTEMMDLKQILLDEPNLQYTIAQLDRDTLRLIDDELGAESVCTRR